MRYAGLMVAALESALGDSFGLADRPGFAQTGDLALHAVGRLGRPLILATRNIAST